MRRAQYICRTVGGHTEFWCAGPGRPRWARSHKSATEWLDVSAASSAAALAAVGAHVAVVMVPE